MEAVSVAIDLFYFNFFLKVDKHVQSMIHFSYIGISMGLALCFYWIAFQAFNDLWVMLSAGMILIGMMFYYAATAEGILVLKRRRKKTLPMEVFTLYFASILITAAFLLPPFLVHIDMSALLPAILQSLANCCFIIGSERVCFIILNLEEQQQKEQDNIDFITQMSRQP